VQNEAGNFIVHFIFVSSLHRLNKGLNSEQPELDWFSGFHENKWAENISPKLMEFIDVCCLDYKTSVGGIPNSKEVCICEIRHNYHLFFANHCGKIQEYT